MQSVFESKHYFLQENKEKKLMRKPISPLIVSVLNAWTYDNEIELPTALCALINQFVALVTVSNCGEDEFNGVYFMDHKSKISHWFSNYSGDKNDIFIMNHRDRLYVLARSLVIKSVSKWVLCRPSIDWSGIYYYCLSNNELPPIKGWSAVDENDNTVPMLSGSVSDRDLSVTVSGCGLDELNGVYSFAGLCDDYPVFEKKNIALNMSYTIYKHDTEWRMMGLDDSLCVRRTYYHMDFDCELPPSYGWETAVFGIEPTPTLSGDVVGNSVIHVDNSGYFPINGIYYEFGRQMNAPKYRKNHHIFGVQFTIAKQTPGWTIFVGRQGFYCTDAETELPPSDGWFELKFDNNTPPKLSGNVSAPPLYVTNPRKVNVTCGYVYEHINAYGEYIEYGTELDSPAFYRIIGNRRYKLYKRRPFEWVIRLTGSQTLVCHNRNYDCCLPPSRGWTVGGNCNDDIYNYDSPDSGSDSEDDDGDHCNYVINIFDGCDSDIDNAPLLSGDVFVPTYINNPRVIEVTNAGCEQCNGIYTEFGAQNRVPKFKRVDGIDEYVIIYGGRTSKYDNTPCKWFIMSGNKPYYVIETDAELPPSDGWKVCENGLLPLPSFGGAVSQSPSYITAPMTVSISACGKKELNGIYYEYGQHQNAPKFFKVTNDDTYEIIRRGNEWMICQTDSLGLFDYDAMNGIDEDKIFYTYQSKSSLPPLKGWNKTNHSFFPCPILSGHVFIPQWLQRPVKISVSKCGTKALNGEYIESGRHNNGPMFTKQNRDGKIFAILRSKFDYYNDECTWRIARIDYKYITDYFYCRTNEYYHDRLPPNSKNSTRKWIPTEFGALPKPHLTVDKNTT